MVTGAAAKQREQAAESAAGDHAMPKGYKRTELGVIPKDWGIESIENLAKITTGSKNTQDRIEDGEYPFFVRSQTVERINSYAFDKEAVLTAGDGVGTGKVFHYIKGKFNAHQRVYCISDFTNRLNGYYFYLYFSSHFYNRIMQMTAKSSVDSVRREMIARMLIPLPPTEAEQQAIAEALSDVDGWVASLDALIAKKRAIKTATMQQLLTGRTRLAGFSGKWEEKRVDEFTDCVSGGTPSTLVPQYWHGTIRWMSSGELNYKIIREVEGRITDIGLDNSAAKMIPSKCVLIGLAGQGKTRGTVAINLVELCTNQSIASILPSKEHISEYLYYNLDQRYDELRSLSTGDGGRGGLNLGIIKSLIIPFPKLEEQTAIATILSDMDAEIDTLEAKREKAAALKQGMMQELLTGKTRLI